MAFGVMTAALALAGVAGNPIGLVIAALFAVVTGLLWDQASGRLASRVYRRVERQAAPSDGGTRHRRRESRQRGGFGAGPRREWTGPGRADGADGTGRRDRRRGRQRYRDGRTRADSDRLTIREAADVLGVEPDADRTTVKRAYRERIKSVHPDTDGGDEERFRRVQSAYERLTD